MRNLTDIYEQAFVKWSQAERGGSKHLSGITRGRATGLIAKASLIHYHGVDAPVRQSRSGILGPRPLDLLATMP